MGESVCRMAKWDDDAAAPGNDLLRIRAVRISPASGNEAGPITMQSAIRVETDYSVFKSGLTLHITYHLVNQDGVTVLTTGCQPAQYEAGDYRGEFILPGDLLNSGDYFLRLLIVQNENHVIYKKDGLASFNVAERQSSGTAWMGREPSVLQLPLPWNFKVRT